MRWGLIGVVALSVLAVHSAARAGDQPLFAPAPAWVLPAPEVDTKDLSQSANFVPLFDQQVKVTGGEVVTYIDVASYIASPETLNQRGTVSLPWQPQHGNLTIHRIEIMRGAERIDTLKGDPGFTVLRREAGLERLQFNGTLTAVKHVEGLRVGDVLRMTFSISEQDKVLNGNAEAGLILIPKPARIGFGRARVIWPAAQALAYKSLLTGIELTSRDIGGGMKEISIPLPALALPEMPADVPSRFTPTPMVALSSFGSWADVAAVMEPHYRAAGAIAAGSDLARVVDGIAARNTDPIERLAAALQVVQEDVRYQLMALGTGNYVPQSPAETWQKRYGDCKAKTMLLLAMLDRLGIKAEPVLAHTKRGDAVTAMPPSAMAFDHVLVRAEIAGESFWLDGTSLGARLADIRDVPRLGLVLPIRASGAELIQLPLRANARLSADVDLALDLSSGPHLPAPFTLKIRYAGTWAAQVRVKEDGEAVEKLRTLAESTAEKWTGSTTIGTPSAQYDPADATWTLSVDGVAYPEWSFADGRYALSRDPTLQVSFAPDRSRSAWRQIPALIDNPWTAQSTLRLILPDGGKDLVSEGTQTHQIENAAVKWQRSFEQRGGELVERIMVRETGAEIAPGDVSSAKKAVSDANGRAVTLTLPAAYPHSWTDLPKRRLAPALVKVRKLFDQRVTDKSDDIGRIDDRAWLAEQLYDWPAALADRSKAIDADPTASRYIARSQLYGMLGRRAEALADAQKAYDLESGDKDARMRLAIELARAGKGDDAIDLTEAVPDLTKEDGQNALLDRAEVLEQAGRHDDAMSLLDDAIARKPSVASFLNARCWYSALRKTGLEQALADCNRAIELAASPAAYLDSRATVHFSAGRLDAALADLDTALALSPEISSSHYTRALVLAAKGDKAGAARAREIAEFLYPEVAAFMKNLGLRN